MANHHKCDPPRSSLDERPIDHTTRVCQGEAIAVAQLKSGLEEAREARGRTEELVRNTNLANKKLEEEAAGLQEELSAIKAASTEDAARLMLVMLA